MTFHRSSTFAAFFFSLLLSLGQLWLIARHSGPQLRENQRINLTCNIKYLQSVPYTIKFKTL